jgi:exopolysaccharide biosynthesis polyprenyl glycosylphosphotransferase
VVLLIALPAYLASLEIVGAYDSMRLANFWQLLRMFFICGITVFLGVAAGLFFLKLDLSRSFIASFCLLATLSLLLERYLVLKALRVIRKKGRNFRSVIICGLTEQTLKLLQAFSNYPELGLGVIKLVDLSPTKDEASQMQFLREAMRFSALKSREVVYGVEGALEALSSVQVDEVIFTNVMRSIEESETLIQGCALQGIRTTIAADIFSAGIATSQVSYFDGLPLIHYQTPPGDRWELSVKRLIDIAFAGAMLIFLSIPLTIIGLAIWISSGRPILFKQKRVGLNGRLFTLYKFRSMDPDAENQKLQLVAKNEMHGPAFKLKDDPRITRIGKFLRRYSLDELPQLWNVLRGDMSLVGPRPPIPGEVTLYERRARRRLSMRPGLTCVWQVSGRNSITDFDSWVKLDLDYIDNWSLSKDLLILLKTVPTVILGNGQ